MAVVIFQDYMSNLTCLAPNHEIFCAKIIIHGRKYLISKI
jgi:hypothetical protein